MGFTPPPAALAVPAAWNSGTSYLAGDLAIRGNALFIANQAHSNQDPVTDCASVLAGTYWTFFALRGGVENYVSTAETVTSTSMTLATTPDTATVFTPNGVLLLHVFVMWKLTGTSIATSALQVVLDGSTQPASDNNAGTDASLTNTGLFWGTARTHQPSGAGGAYTSVQVNTGSDNAVPSVPFTPSGNGSGAPPQVIHTTAGFHTVSVRYKAGNGTTIVNVKERRLVVGAA